MFCWALPMSLRVSVLVLEMAPFLYLSYSFTSNNIPSSLIHDGIEVQWSAWPGRYDICSGTVRLRINFRSYAYTFDENIQEVQSSHITAVVVSF